MLLGAKPSPTQASPEHRIQSCGPTAEVPGALVLRAGSEPDKPARVKLTIARKPAATIPRAQLETITNALHLPNLEHPDQFDRILDEFLKMPR